VAERDPTAAAPVARIGVVGVGRMGMPICARLAGAGFTVVATDARVERRTAALAAGATWAPDVATLARAVDVAITILPGPVEVCALTDELTAALAPGSTWIDMTTAAPSTARAIAAAARRHDLRVLDAPVGGNPEAARDGRLVCFVGAAEGDLEAQRPLLASVADRIVHVGAPGTGYAVKLLVNLLWFGQAVATAEALTLARRAGIDLERLLAALDQSAAASSFIANDARSLLRGDDLAAFSLARCCGQLAAVLALGRELDVPLELAGVVAAAHERALERYGDVDGELLGARFVAERAGVTIDDPVA
jgi:3-hydroxyisobutyrate dehydrogenase